jgi:hypothetical protein
LYLQAPVLRGRGHILISPTRQAMNSPQIAHNHASYAAEYSSLHNQRISLVAMMHLWYQIGVPTSLVIFIGFLSIALAPNNSHILKIILLALAPLLSCGLLLFVDRYARYLDRSILKLYPRILALEIFLDYRFFRHYLQKRGEQEERFVKKCEEFPCHDLQNLSCRVHCEFRYEYFPRTNRGHNWLIGTTIVLAGLFWSIASIVYLCIT